MVDDGVSRNDRPIVKMDVSPQEDSVDEDDVVVETAIVRHVAVGHEQVVAPDSRHVVFLFRAAIDGHSLAKGVSITDFEARRRAGVAVVLRFGPE